MTYNLTLSSATFDTSTEKFGTGAINGGTGISSGPAITAPPFTMECWVKRTSAPSGTVVAFGQMEVGWLGCTSAGYAQASYGNASSVNLASTANICDGSWHHLAMVVTSSGGTFYVDGNQVTSSATTLATSGPAYTGDIALMGYGGGSSVNGNFWAAGGGEVDEAALWNTQKYTGSFTPTSSPYTGSETGLLALYHLDSNGADSAAQVASAYTVAGPTSGTVGTPYTFTLQANGTLASPVTVTITQSGTTGTLSTTTVSLPSGSATPQTFTLTPTAAGTDTLSFSNGGSLTNPPNAIFTASAGVTILPNNSAIYYSPYNWLTNNTAAKTINAGAYLKTIFTGASCTLNFSLQTTPYPYIVVFIDGQQVYSGVISASISLTIPSATSTWPHHFLEVIVKGITASVDRWNTQAAALVLSNIALASGAAVSLPNVAPRNILFLGDSITEGCWTISPDPQPGSPSPDNQYFDATLGWAYLQGGLLGAEVGIVGFTRQGFVETGLGNIPVFNSTFAYLWSGQARSFTPAPDLIIINMGTNDSSFYGITGAQLQAAAATMLTNLLAATTSKIVIMEPFDGNYWSYLLAAVSAVASNRITSMSTTGFLNTTDTSDGLHPLGVANLGTIAPQVATALKPILSPASSTPSIHKTGAHGGLS